MLEVFRFSFQIAPNFLLPVMLLLWYHRKQSKKGIYPADGIVVMIKVAFS